MAIQLNSDQRGAVDEMHVFAKGPEPFFLLLGSAGTGKTTCVQTFVKETRLRVVLTAPTNKASKVLRETARQELEGTVDACTVYSLLGLKLESNGEYRTITASEEGNKANQYDVIVVDEGSMVNDSLFGHICKAAQEFGVKFLFMGDQCQLPPVKQEDGRSQVLDIRYYRKLTKVERHDNQILTLANHIRLVQTGQTPLVLQSDNDANGGVYKLNWKALRKRACEAFTSDSYKANPHSFKVIAWRNDQVKLYNDIIRDAMYGPEMAAEMPFHEGERIVTCQPIMTGDELAMATDEEGTVEMVVIMQHPIYGNLKVYAMTIQPDFGSEWCVGFVVHEDSRRDYNAMLTEMSNSARIGNGSWAAFWDLKDSIHDIRPCHAITSHRAQGSTYDTVFVDTNDILSNQNRLEALQALYVACSRPRRIAVLC